MVVFIFIIIIIFILIIFVSSFNSTSESSTEIKTNYKTGEKTIDLDVPNPNFNPEKFLHFIKETDKDYLWQIKSNLDISSNLENIVLRKALDEKSTVGTLNLEYYLKILDKIKTDSFETSELEKDLANDFEFITSFKIAGTFISYRKENLIYNIDEGSEVILKREPHNKFDPNAIVVMKDKNTLGYVPRIENEFISEILKFNHVAKIADIIYKDDFIDVIVNIYKSKVKNSNPAYFLDNTTILELRSRKIDSKFLTPKKDVENLNMFFKRKVVITGEFEYFVNRNELALILFDSGADIDSCVTERVNYMIVGNNPGWKKMEKAEAFGIMIFNEVEIKKILNI